MISKKNDPDVYGLSTIWFQLRSLMKSHSRDVRWLETHWFLLVIDGVVFSQRQYSASYQCWKPTAEVSWNNAVFTEKTAPLFINVILSGSFKSMPWYKKDVTPVRQQWGYVFLALYHQKCTLLSINVYNIYIYICFSNIQWNETKMSDI